MKTLTKAICWLIILVVGALIGFFVGWVIVQIANNIPAKIIVLALIFAALCFWCGRRYERDHRQEQHKQQAVKFQKKKRFDTSA